MMIYTVYTRLKNSFLPTAVFILPLLLTLTRLLYEGLFPRWLWLGRPFPVWTLALVGSVALSWGTRRFFGEGKLSVWVLLPLLINGVTLLDRGVNLQQSRFLLAASLWLTVLLIALARASERRWRWLGPLFVITAVLPIYLLTMPDSVGRADTFEFQVVVPQLGIVHPTGYPLYLLLGKLFTLIPINSVAWRLNMATAVYAMLASLMIYWVGHRLTRQPIVAVLGAVTLALTPTFWSQAIEAEVYSLHALVVTTALWLMLRLYETREARWLLGLALLSGIGMSNHVTTVFLLPAIGLLLLWMWRQEGIEQAEALLIKHEKGRFFGIPWAYWGRIILAGLAPLLLYAYLPLRWAAVNKEPMGVGRFFSWVVGGRFQDALQWGAWLNDPTRYEVMQNLILHEWHFVELVLMGLGGALLLFGRWRQLTMAYLLVAIGFIFYALNYYVPDLAVFIIPAHLILALLITASLAGVWRWQGRPVWLVPLITAVYVAWLGGRVGERWPMLDRSDADQLAQWGQGVLARPLAEGSAILADSEKIAPLYYWQQAEGVRPDLDIMVLPDEAAYRAVLNERIEAEQTVYLARFLPGLEGSYHLRSQGPLTEVGTTPLTILPSTATPTEQQVGPLQLVGYTVEPVAAIDAQATAVTLYWRASEPVDEVWHVFVRWQGGDPVIATGQHPANNDYPTVAWKGEEIVPDFHLLPHPLASEASTVVLQVALARPFTTPTAWQTVTEVTVPPQMALLDKRQLRAQVGTVQLSGTSFPSQIRPEMPLVVQLTGFGEGRGVDLRLVSSETAVAAPTSTQRPVIPLADSVPFAETFMVDTALPEGHYQLVASSSTGASWCGWLAPLAVGCSLGEVELSGVPLPADAANFEDKIALLDIDVADTALQPGGQLAINLTWQSLTSVDKDYTVFVQILNDQDQLVGQVDAWPLQGTYPTSQWQVGEVVNDPYLVQLASDLPAGNYRLQVGMYLLADLRRLSVWDEAGIPVEDKVAFAGLRVE